jgi:peptidoglycan/xylan/chitin deacetylase (PgdA/CDA1 family)
MLPNAAMPEIQKMPLTKEQPMKLSSKRSSTFALVTALLVGSATVAVAADCPNPKALGTSRTLAIDARAFPLVGKDQYEETLPLNNREVVLSFDDGPSSPYTEMVLEALANECVKATFFVLGENAVDDPELVRRVAKEGHTIGTHAYEHIGLDTLAFEDAKKQIDRGIKAATDALQGGALAPFFRAPELDLSPQLEKHIISRGLMIWSIDVDSFDWNGVTEEQLVEDTIKSLEKAGKGIVLMHDIQPVTARALPLFLEELKSHNFKVVHVVPGAPRGRSTAAATR